MTEAVISVRAKIVALTVVIAGGVGPGRAVQARAQALSTTPSIAIVEGNGANVDAVYWVTGQTLSSTAVSAVPGLLPPTPALLPAGARPAAISYSAGVTAYYDPDNARVMVLPAGREARAIPYTPDGGVGSIAVGPSANAVVVISRAGRLAAWDLAKGDRIRTLQLAGHPVGAVFDDNDLLFLDDDTGRLMVVSGIGGTGVAEVRPAINGLLQEQLKRVEAFSSYRGVLYVAGENGVAIVPRGFSELIWVTSATFGRPLAGRRFSAVAASESWLTLLDRQGNAVTVPRPVPTLVTIAAATETERESVLIALYDYLAAKGLLRTQRIALRTGATLSQVVPRLLAIDVSTGGRIVPSLTLTSYLTGLIGKLNPDASLSRLLAGQELVAPDQAVAESRGWQFVTLAGDTVDDVLARNHINLASDIDLKQFGSAIVDRNTTAGALTSFLRRYNLVSGSVTTRPWPGDVVQVNGPTMQVVGNVSQCGRGEPVLKFVPVTVSPYFDTVRGEGLLPADLPGLPGDSRWKALAHFDDTWLRSLDEDLSKYNGCAVLAGNRTYVVQQALTAKTADIQFARADGEVQPGVGAQIAARLQARPDISDSSSIRVAKEFSVGVSLVDAKGVSPAPWSDVSDARLKELRAQKTGRVELPVLQWELRVMFPAPELRTTGELQALIRRHPQLRPVPLERSSAKPAFGSDDGQSNRSHLVSAEEAGKNRKRLTQEISFPAELVPALTSVKIGMLEHVNSLNFLNQDLKDAQIGPKLVLQAPDGCDRAVDDVPDDGFDGAGQVLAKCHHATFIAGLLVSQSDLARGLLPAGSLYVIDVEGRRDHDILLDIENAVRAGYRVINISQILTEATAEFASKVHDLQNVLFVGPAHRKEDRRRDNTPPPPLGYEVDDFSHVIGVAPRKSRNEPMPDDKAVLTSRKYIQVAAPGFDVASSIGPDKYMSTSGASIAVPLVAATAALISPETEVSAPRLKMRLIYTADWLPTEQTEDHVWGGYLNARRAIRSSHELLVLPGSPGTELEVDLECPERAPGAPEKSDKCGLTISGGHPIDRDVVDDLAPEEFVTFNNVLRVTRSDEEDTHYRVIAIIRGRMRIINGAALTGAFRYRVHSTYAASGAQKPVTVEDGVVHQHEWAEIQDFTARLNRVSRETKF